jgi:hypothetical protein
MVAVYDMLGRKVFYQDTNLGGGKREMRFTQGLKLEIYLAVIAGKAGAPHERIRFVVK